MKLTIGILLYLIFSVFISAQTYQLSVSNIKYSGYTCEFDVFIQSTQSNFILTSYQAALTFNTQIINNGVLNFKYLQGSSELKNVPMFGILVNKFDGAQELSFASNAFPPDTITISRKKVGHFILSNSVLFSSNELNLNWSFSGRSSTIITGIDFQNITNASYCKVEGLNDQIILFAEKGYLGNGAALKTKTGSRGSKVVYCTTNSSYIKFNVQFPKTGTWYIWGRFFFEGSGNSPNSFNVKIDNSTAKSFGNNKDYFNKWHWGGDGSIQTGTTTKLLLGYLNAGNHTIVVSGREPGSLVMIDQIFLTLSTSLIPNDNIVLSKDTLFATEEIQEIPDECELMQNYPNPFNPSTTIRYKLNSNEHVSLQVYDILGNEVKTLVDDIKEAGVYDVSFNGRDLASGLYIYTLRTGNYSSSKKFILLK